MQPHTAVLNILFQFEHLSFDQLLKIFQNAANDKQYFDLIYFNNQHQLKAQLPMLLNYCEIKDCMRERALSARCTQRRWLCARLGFTIRHVAAVEQCRLQRESNPVSSARQATWLTTVLHATQRSLSVKFSELIFHWLAKNRLVIEQLPIA
ncbi:hypothetical protein T07_14927 [Trichinella nelsoni]|uniref:Uncharacterized protein n=1 Tax=Trichinella nelsoni TaxID=6336 RepID=A0A0V0SLY7_9BILA|nr:hypothetical protein T07_14927 [Trichinella nelsoni]